MVEQFIDGYNGGDSEVLAEYVEHESGKHTDRPKLDEAVRHCKLTGVTLVVAKLDRLARDAYFLLKLQRELEAHGVEIVCANNPHLNKFTLTLFAVIAEWEREQISQRTSQALGSIRWKIQREGSYVSRSGRTITRLGNPEGAKPFQGRKGYKRAAKVRSAKAADRAQALASTIADIQASGITTPAGIAAELERRRIRTAQGGRWHPASVARVLERLQ